MKKGEHYMGRKRVSPRKDKAIFKRTAVGTKTINVSPKTMRGGTRL